MEIARNRFKISQSIQNSIQNFFFTVFLKTLQLERPKTVTVTIGFVAMSLPRPAQSFSPAMAALRRVKLSKNNVPNMRRVTGCTASLTTPKYSLRYGGQRLTIALWELSLRTVPGTVPPPLFPQHNGPFIGIGLVFKNRLLFSKVSFKERSWLSRFPTKSCPSRPLQPLATA